MTIHAWRIVQAHLADQAFSGEGARLYGGRWNHVGTAVVYAASTRSLALLELLAHASAQYLRRPYKILRVSFTAAMMDQVFAEMLPDGWNEYPAQYVTKDMGTQWAKDKRTVALAVPSALVPQESNFLLNPLHPAFSKLTIGSAETLHVDNRFLMDAEPTA